MKNPLRRLIGSDWLMLAALAWALALAVFGLMGTLLLAVLVLGP